MVPEESAKRPAKSSTSIIEGKLPSCSKKLEGFDGVTKSSVGICLSKDFYSAHRSKFVDLCRITGGQGILPYDPAAERYNAAILAVNRMWGKMQSHGKSLQPKYDDSNEAKGVQEPAAKNAS